MRLLSFTLVATLAASTAFASSFSDTTTLGVAGSVGAAKFQSFSTGGGASSGTGASAGLDQSYATFTGSNTAGFANGTGTTTQFANAQTGTQFNEASSGNGFASVSGFGDIAGSTAESVLTGFKTLDGFQPIEKIVVHTNND